MLTPDQVKMARAVMGWSVLELAKRAGVNPNTVKRFERNENVTVATLVKLQQAMEAAGITLIPENGGPATIRPPRRLAEASSHRSTT